MTWPKRVEHGGGCWPVQYACDAAGKLARGRERILVVSPQTTVLQECDGQVEDRRAEFGACDFGAWLGAVQHGRKERKENCHPQAEGCELVRERYATRKACEMELGVHVAVQHARLADTKVLNCGAWGLAEHDQAFADRSGVRFELLPLGVA